MPFYSQYGEDNILSAIFADHQGWCVEVGANDGVTYSTTKYFEEIGWKCVLVEPTPSLCKSIRSCRTAQLFECAASTADGEAQLQFVESMSLFSSLEQRSTMQSRIDAATESVRSVTVRTRRLDSILTEAGVGPLDFVTIDVEGHELSVLQGFDLDRWRPSIVIVEDDTDLGETPVSQHLAAARYVRFYRSGGNDWYWRRDEFRRRRIVRLVQQGVLDPTKIARGMLPVFLRASVLRSLRAMRAWSSRR